MFTRNRPSRKASAEPKPIKPTARWLAQAALLKKSRPPTQTERIYWDSAARALGVPDDWIYDDEAGEFRPKT